MKATNKLICNNAIAIALYTVSTTAMAQDFHGVKWSSDTSNTPEAEEHGCGEVPDTDSTGPLTFELVGNCTTGVQRQEFKYERRLGFHRMNGDFTIDSKHTDFNAISIAQTHDDLGGSDGVFTIYRITNENGQLYFGVQGDHLKYYEADQVAIYPDRVYNMSIKTYSDGSDSYETAEVFYNGQRIWMWTVSDGGNSGSGDDKHHQYKKIGAYELTGGYGSMTVTWDQVVFFTGQR